MPSPVLLAVALIRTFIDRGWLSTCSLEAGLTAVTIPKATVVAPSLVPLPEPRQHPTTRSAFPYDTPPGSVQDVLERRGRLLVGSSLYWMQPHARQQPYWSRPASAHERRFADERHKSKEASVKWGTGRGTEAATALLLARRRELSGACNGITERRITEPQKPPALFRRPPGGWRKPFDRTARIPR